jgi:hypothetical protein
MKKQLIFETLNEFQQYVVNNNISLNELEIFEIDKETVSPIIEGVLPKVCVLETADVQLISLHDNPTIKAKLGENNVLYVDDIQINENSCMPAQIDLLGRKVSVILCNQDGKTHANLSIALNSAPRYNVVFEVRKLNGESFTMEIAKDMTEKKDNDT